MGRVSDKVVLVTGGASGLGKAIATLFVFEGAKVTISDINEKNGAEVAKEIGVDFIHQDVANEENWQSTVNQIVSNFGRLDILVNNAGIGDNAKENDPENTTLEAWNETLAVNAGGAFLGCKYAIAAMRKSGSGSIVNLSSIAALAGTPFLTAYGASKAAVRQLTMSVALHCAENGYGIRCNSVHPGQITTPMHNQLIENLADSVGLSEEDMRGEFLKKIPMAEFGEPKDIAYAVLYLASDEAKHVTGEQLVVDGGMNIL